MGSFHRYVSSALDLLANFPPTYIAVLAVLRTIDRLTGKPEPQLVWDPNIVAPGEGSD